MRYLFVLMFVFWPILSAADPIAGKIIRIKDGDTVVVLRADMTEVTVRLSAIDAPESCKFDEQCSARPGQPFGTQAGLHLQKIASGKVVSKSQCYGADPFKREVCRLWVGDVDIGEAMVKEGYAWVALKYNAPNAYVEALAAAQTQRAGLWSQTAPIEPWVWRKSCWKEKQCSAPTIK
jgi:micrococcal nuclease